MAINDTALGTLAFRLPRLVDLPEFLFAIVYADSPGKAECVAAGVRLIVLPKVYVVGCSMLTTTSLHFSLQG